MTRTWTKHYQDPSRRRRAVANHRWLAEVGSPVRVPELYAETPRDLRFEFVAGRHAMPGDLPGLARHLGTVHGIAHDLALREARLDRPHRTARGDLIPDFVKSRLTALRQRLGDDRRPGMVAAAEQSIEMAATLPGTFYKDTNPRNVLLTHGGPVMVDFDDLTLAPFGYDLAKLVVTLAMTYGALPAELISEALTAYNAAIAETSPGLDQVRWHELMAWADLHHILTAPYLGRGGYLYPWPRVRPRHDS